MNPTWRKSSYSGQNGGDCVETALLPQSIAVRDSKNPDGPRLTFTTDAWLHFIGAVQTGQLPLETP